jgi:heme-degrading monooxygenase HmoA
MNTTVTLINPFEIPKGKEEKALLMWEKAADFMRIQPGFISTSLHQSIDPNARFSLINIAKWESAEHFQAVINSSEFKALTVGSMEAFPHYPGLYQVVRE